MSTNYDTLSRNRVRLLILIAIAFTFWMIFGSDIMSAMIGDKVSEALSILGKMFFIAGIAGTIFIWRKKFRGSDEEIQAALQDELVDTNRRRATEIGFYILLSAVFSIYTLGLFSEISTRDIGRFLLILGVSVPLFIFARLEAADA